MNPGWRETIEAARLRPQMWLGELADAHLKAAAENPSWVLWRLGPFAAPVKLQVTVSPHQLQLVAHTGPMSDSVADVFDWARFDVLVDELWRVGSKLRQEARDSPGWPVYRENLHLGILAAPALFSTEGAIAIAGEGGMWCQYYVRGWPVCEPLLVNSQPGPVGFKLVAALDPSVFSGLPYRLEVVQEAIPDYANCVSVKWHEDDDLLTKFSSGHGCILIRDQLRKWVDESV